MVAILLPFVLLLLAETTHSDTFSGRSALSTIRTIRQLIKLSQREATKKATIPMQPIDPVPAGPTLDYFNYIFGLLDSIKRMEHDIKKRTYSYGLMVVGRPLEELSFGQQLLRAALMPTKYYEDVATTFIQRINRLVNSTSINGSPASRQPSVLLRLLRSMFSLTPVIKSRTESS